MLRFLFALPLLYWLFCKSSSNNNNIVLLSCLHAHAHTKDVSGWDIVHSTIQLSDERRAGGFAFLSSDAHPNTRAHTHTHNTLPCQTHDRESLLTSRIASPHCVSSPLFGHSARRWGGLSPREKNRKQLTQNPWVMLTWCVLITGCPGYHTHTHTQGRSCRALLRGYRGYRMTRDTHDHGHARVRSKNLFWRDRCM